MRYSSPTSLSQQSLPTRHKLTESDIALLQPQEFSGRFKVVEKLGSGAFGDIHRVRDNNSKHDRALKVLQQTACRSSGPAPEVALFREARALKHARHKNIVELVSILRIPRTLGAETSPIAQQLWQLWQQQQGRSTSCSRDSKAHAGGSGGHGSGRRDADKGSCWALLLECMECGSLAHVILKQMTHPHIKQYNDMDALTWALDIASGLEHMHGLNPMIIHRDLKSENILLQKLTAASSSSSSSRKLPVAKISDMGLHVMLDKPPCNFVIRSDGGCPMMVFQQYHHQQQQQQQDAIRQSNDHTHSHGESSAESSCEADQPCSCPAQFVNPIATTTAVVRGSALKPPASPVSKDVRCVKHVAFTEDQQQKQQQQLEKDETPVTAADGSPHSSSDSAVVVEPLCGAAAANKSTCPQQQQTPLQQQHLMPLTVRTLKRLSMESACSGASAALGTPRKPVSVNSVTTQGILLTVQAAANGSGFCRASVAATAVTAAAAECGSCGGKAASEGAAARATAGSSDITVMLTAANSEHDYQVSISTPGETHSRRNSCGSTPPTPTAAADRSRPGTPKSLRSVSTTTPSVGDFPTAASMLWDDIMEEYGCQDLLDQAEPLSPTVLAYDLTHHTGSCMYMAPEVYKCQPYNEAVDVFSLGVILYELFSRTLLIYTHTPASSPSDSVRYAKRVSQGYRPQSPKNVSRAVWQIIDRCWSQDPCARPSAAWVVQQLQQLLDAEEAAAANSGLRSWLRRGAAPQSLTPAVLPDSRPPKAASTVADSANSSGSSSAVSVRPTAASAVPVSKDHLPMKAAATEPGARAASARCSDSRSQRALCGCVIC